MALVEELQQANEQLELMAYMSRLDKYRGICAVLEGLILLVSRAGSDLFTPQKNERMRAGGRPNGQFPDFHPRLQ